MPYLVSLSFRFAVALGLAVLVLLVGMETDVDRSDASHAGGMDEMSLDLGIAGNTAANVWTWSPPLPVPPVGHSETLGPVDATIALNPCDEITLDLIALNIPASQPMLGFSGTLNFNAGVFEGIESSAGFLMTANAGSSLFDPGASITPDSMVLSAADVGTPPGAYEVGSGVLARARIKINPGAAPGDHPITLDGGAHISGSDGQPYLPDETNSAIVTLTGSCNGDVDCSASSNSIDALKILRHNAGLSVDQTEPCANIGTDIGTRSQGDVDCSGGISSVDSLKVLRASAGLSVTQQPGCPPILG